MIVMILLISEENTGPVPLQPWQIVPSKLFPLHILSISVNGRSIINGAGMSYVLVK
jgi:hypothetical protein